MAAALLLAACGNPALRERQERSLVAKVKFQERCKTAGIKIHRRVENVEGVMLLKLRGWTDVDNQFTLDDPYGRDLAEIGYIQSMLRGAYQAETKSDGSVKQPPRLGYLFVEAIDPKDGVRYRYTGRLEERWLTDKRFLKGDIWYMVDKTPATGPAPRYGVTYDDISTREDREYWIAGSSLRVIDLHTNEVIAERIGYMYDTAQGANSGGRSPWLFAPNNACPSFYDRYPGAKPTGPYAASIQSFQTLDFVESVLTPSP